MTTNSHTEETDRKRQHQQIDRWNKKGKHTHTQHSQWNRMIQNKL